MDLVASSSLVFRSKSSSYRNVTAFLLFKYVVKTAPHNLVVRFCPTNRAGTNRIQLWVNVDGERSTLYLDLRADPNEFKKDIFSRKSNHINRYCSEIRRKIDEYYTDCTIRGLQVRASTLTDYVRNGYEERQYTVYGLFEDFSRLIKKRVGAEIGSSTYRKYLLAKTHTTLKPSYNRDYVLFMYII